MRIFFRFKIL